MCGESLYVDPVEIRSSRPVLDRQDPIGFEPSNHTLNMSLGAAGARGDSGHRRPAHTRIVGLIGKGQQHQQRGFVVLPRIPDRGEKTVAHRAPPAGVAGFIAPGVVAGHRSNWVSSDIAATPSVYSKLSVVRPRLSVGSALLGPFSCGATLQQARHAVF